MTTFWTPTQADSLLPTYYVPPLVNPSPGGLAAAVSWTDQTTPPRWVEGGLAIRAGVTGNYSGELSAGVWGAGWCEEPGSGEGGVKSGVRPDDPDTFLAVTTWGYDECDLTAGSRAEILARCQQVQRMRESVLVAREFAARLLIDGGVPTAADDLTDAIGEIEAIFADANTLGAVHCSPFLLPALVSRLLASRINANTYVTPSGHQLVLDGGYRLVLGDALLIATSKPLFGWRVAVAVRDAIDYEHNRYYAIAERSVVIGYEACLGAVAVGGSL